MKQYGNIATPAAQTPAKKMGRSGSAKVSYSKRNIIRTPASQTPRRKA